MLTKIQRRTDLDVLYTLNTYSFILLERLLGGLSSFRHYKSDRVSNQGQFQSLPGLTRTNFKNLNTQLENGGLRQNEASGSKLTLKSGKLLFQRTETDLCRCLRIAVYFEIQFGFDRLLAMKAFSGVFGELHGRFAVLNLGGLRSSKMSSISGSAVRKSWKLAPPGDLRLKK